MSGVNKRRRRAERPKRPVCVEPGAARARKARLLVEPLEPRVLLAADLAAGIELSASDLASAAPPAVEIHSLGPETSPAQRVPGVSSSQTLELQQTLLAPVDLDALAELYLHYSLQSDPAARAEGPQVRVNGAAETASASDLTRHEVVLVDAGVAELDSLLQALTAHSDPQRLIAVHVLESDRDGIEQVNQVLSGYRNLDAVHVFSHGARGIVQLGASALDAATLRTEADEIRRWGAAFGAGADLLLYGCEVAAGADGRALINGLGRLVGADVAASDDLTGAARLGGDWALEYASGVIESNLIHDAPGLPSWSGTLALANVRDAFDTLDFAGDDGTASWLGPWQEIGEADGASLGEISVQSGAGFSSNHLSIQLGTPGKGVSRGVDLSAADAATLSFEYRRFSGGAGAVSLDVWDADTGNWTSLYSYDLSASDANRVADIHDLTPYLSSNTQIRFQVTGADAGSTFSVDNVRIAFGSNQSPLVAVPGTQATAQDVPLALGSGTGNAVTVTDDAGGHRVEVSIGVSNGTLTLSQTTDVETVVNTTASNDQTLPVVAMAPDGRSVVVWQSASQDGDGDGIYARRIAADGTPDAAGESRVNTTVADHQRSPAVAMDDAGNFVVVWQSENQDGDGWGIYAQRFAADGTPAPSGEFRVNTTVTDQQTDPSVAMDAAGNFVVVWQSVDQDGDGTGVYARLFAADGTPDPTGERLVNTTTVKHQRASAVGMNAAGAFVVAWQSENQDGDLEGVYAQAFAADGTPHASGELAVNTTIANNQITPTVAIDDAGAFVVAWTSANQDGDNDGVYARRFAADGVALTDELQVNTSVAKAQRLPALALGASGEFVIAWQSTDQDGSGDGVYAQVYHPDGSAQGPEFRLSTTTAGDQSVPALALADSGHFLIVWQSANQDGDGDGIVARRFPPGGPLDFSLGDGSADSAMTFTGRLAAVNEALEGMVFTPTAGFNGAAAIAINVDDQGHSGAGGARIGSASVDIAVGVAPLLNLDADASSGASLRDFAATFTAGAGSVAIAGADALVSDADSATLSSLTVTVTNPLDGGSEVLAADTTGTAIVAAFDSGVLSLTGVDTLAHYQQVLRSVTYDNAASNPDKTTRIISFLASDGVYAGNLAVAAVTVVAPNVAPVNSVPGPTQRTAQDTPLLFSDANANRLMVGDLDAPFGSGELQVTLSATNGTLTLTQPIGVERRVNTTTNRDQSQPQLAATADGRTVFVWQSVDQDGDGEGIYARTFDANGNPSSGEIQVNSTTTDAQNTPAVAVDAAGNFVVVWVSKAQDNADGREGIYARLFDASGTALSGELLVNQTTLQTQMAPAVAMAANGDFVITWQSKAQDDPDGKEGIYARRYHGDGSVKGGEFLVNTTTANAQTEPAIAMAANGNFVIAWQSTNQDGSGEGIYARLFSAAGIGLGGEVPVNSTSAGHQRAPQVAAAADGRFVVVWQSKGQDNPDNSEGVYARLFDASAGAASPELLVSQTTLDDQSAPGVVMGDDGAFSVVWTSTAQDNPDGADGVYARYFDASGTPRSEEFRVNTTTVDAQQAPAISMDAAGRLTVAWQSNDQDGDKLGVYQKHYRLGFSAGEGTADTTITLRGAIADLNDALNGLRFDPAAGYTGPAALDIMTNDLGNFGTGPALTDTDTIDIVVGDGVLMDLDLDNSAGVAGADFRSSFVAGGGPVPVADVDAVLEDLARLNLLSLTVTITNLIDGASELLAADTSGTAIVASYDDASGVLTLSGSDTIGNYQKVLRSVTYDNIASTPDPASRIIEFAADDGYVAGNVATTTVHVSSSNAAPTLTLSGGALSYTENSPGLLVNSGAKVGDPDSVNLDGGSLTVRLYSGGTVNDSLFISPGAGVSVSGTDVLVDGVVVGSFAGGSAGTDLLISWNSSSSPAKVETVMRRVAFANASDDPDPTSRVVDFVLTDGDSGTSNTVQQTIHMARVEDAPVIALPVSPLEYAEQAPPMLLGTGATLSDPDTLVFNGATLTIDFSAGAQADDRLAIRDLGPGAGNISLAGTDVRYDFGAGAVLIGTFSGGSSGTDPLVVSLNGAADAIAVQALIANLNYQYIGDAPSTTDRSVRFVLSDGEGATSAPVTRTVQITPLNDAPVVTVPGTQTTPQDVALVLSSGGVNAVLVADDSGDHRVKVSIDVSNGTLTLSQTSGAETIVNNTATDDQSEPALATSADGRSVVVWQSLDQDGDGFGIYARRVAADGTPDPGGEFRVNTTVLDEQSSAAVAIDDTGNFVVVWQSIDQDGDGAGIYAQRYAADGTPDPSGEFRVNTTVLDEQSSPAVAMDAAGSFVVVWQSRGQDGNGDGIYAQRYAANGTPDPAGELLVNTTTANHQSAPSVAMNATGQFVIAWTSANQDGGGLGVYAQAFAADGTPDPTGEIAVNTTTGDDQSMPVVVIGDGGEFVVAWQSKAQDGDREGVYAQRFAADGSALGAELQVNSTTAKEQELPAIALGPSGELVIVWQSTAQDGSGTGVYAQVYHPDGSAQGPEFRVNTTTANDQGAVSVAMTDSGHFVVAWQSADQDGDGEGIVLRRLPPGGPLDFSVGDGIADSAMTFTGRLVTINTALESMTFTPTPGFNGAAGITLGVDDQGQSGTGGALTDTANVAIVVGSAPLLDLDLDASSGVLGSGYSTAFLSGAGPVLIADADALVSDPDSASLASLTVTLTNLLDGAAEALAADTTGTSILAAYDSGTGVLSLTGVDTLAHYQQVLRSVSYDNGAPAPDKTPRLMSFVANDGVYDSNVAVTTLTIVAPNVAPVITAPGAQSVAEDTPLLFNDLNLNRITVADADAVHGSGEVQVTLSVTNGSLTLSNTIGPEQPVNITIGNDQSQPQIAATPDGRTVLVWVSKNQDGNSEGVYARTFAADGSPSSAEIPVNITTTDAQNAPVVAVDAAGNFVVVWVSKAQDNADGKEGVYARLFNAGGTALSGELLVNQNKPDAQMAPSVAMAANGDFVITWQSKNQDDPDGKEGIYARRFNADGSVKGNEFLVNTTTGNAQTAPVIALAGNGDFVIAWQSSNQDGSGDGIYARLFGAGGAALSGEVAVNTTTADHQSAPRVSAAADGRFVVAWQSKGQDNPDNTEGVYARLFDASAAAASDELLVAQTTLNDQSAPSVVMDDDGAFVVGWTSTGQDNPDGLAGVYARHFNVLGAARSDEFLVNTTTADAQQAPAMAMYGMGHFIVAWHSDNQDGNGLGVYQQRFLSFGAISYSVGDGSDDATMTFRGTLENINNALLGLRFDPSAEYNGPASLDISIDDLGNFGTGPAQTDAVSVAITVTAVNDAPVLSVPAAGTTDEDFALVFSIATGNPVSVADLDAGAGELELTLSVANGRLHLAGTGGLTFSLGADGSSSMTFTGQLGDINAALDGLSYRPDPLFTGADALNVSVDDQGNTGAPGALGDTAVIALTINDFNDPPINDLPGPQLTLENTPLVFSGANAITIADEDAAGSDLEVSLSVTHGVLTLGGVTGLNFIDGDGTADTSMTFRAKVSEINTAMAGMRFIPIPQYAGPALLEISTNDLGNSGPDGDKIDSDTLLITVTPDASNDPPLHTVPGPQGAIEGVPLVFSDAGSNRISVNDDAGGNAIQVTLTAIGGTISLNNFAGSEFQVNTAITDEQRDPQVTMTPGGAYVVVWTSHNQDGDGDGIYVQRYDPAGVALGTETRVNTRFTSDQSEAAIAVADDGSFVVVWASNNQDGDKQGIFAQRFDSGGRPTGNEFQVNTTTAKAQSGPAVAIDAAGNFVIAWQSDGQDGDGWGIVARRFDNTGAPLGAEIAVNTTTANHQLAPALAIDAAGNFVVAWQSEDQDGDDFGIVARRFDASGAALGAEILVNNVAFKDQVNADIAMDAAGNFVVVWQSEDIDYPDGKDGVYARRFDAAGAAQGNQFLVNQTTPRTQSQPSVAMDDSGRFVIAWQSENQDHPDKHEGVYARSYDAAGNAIGNEFQVNTFTAKEQTRPSVAMGNAGRFVVVWESKDQDGGARGVFGQRFRDLGELSFSIGDGSDDPSMTFTGTLDSINDALDGLSFLAAPDVVGLASLRIVTNDLGHSGSGGPLTDDDTIDITVSTHNDAPVITAPVPQSTGEDIVLVFSSGNLNAIAVGDADADTDPLEVTLVATAGSLTLNGTGGLSFTTGDGADDPSMTFSGSLNDINSALDGLRFTPLAGYTGAASVQIVVDDLGNNGAGGALSTSRTVAISVTADATNDPPRVTVPAPQRTAQDTPLGFDDGAGNTISIADDAAASPVQATLTAINGTFTLSPVVQGEARVNTTTLDHQTNAAVAMRPDGGWLAVWQSKDQDGSGEGIYAQRYNAAGAPEGGEFRVNTTTANNQTMPAVAVNASGEAVVVWQSTNQDGAGEGIYAQRFDASGQALGDELLVNSTVVGDQSAPVVGMDDAGKFVIAWQGANQDGSGDGIFAQWFDANGVTQGGEVQVNTSIADHQRAPALAMDTAGNVVVAWQSKDQDGNGEGIFAQRFAADRSRWDGEFQVNSTITNNQSTPAVAINGVGDFMIAWQSTNQDGSGEGIYAQRYYQTGYPAGDEFRVATTTADHQRLPTIAAGADGNFVIVWQSANQDGDGEGIYGQSFDPFGVKVDAEFRINTTTLNNQRAPAVAAAADGGFAVVWTDSNLDGAGDGVFSQRFSKGGALAYITGDGQDDTLTVLTGTTKAINQALDGLIFTPDLGFTGLAGVRLAVNDLGNSGSGGPQSAVQTANIIVGGGPLLDLDADDSSGATGSGYAALFTAGGGPVAVADADALLSDLNTGTLLSLTVTLTNLLDGTDERLAADTAGTSIVANYDSGTGVLSLTVADTLAHYQQVLRTITYDNTAPSPDATPRGITFVANDGSDDSNLATASVTWTNNPPIAAPNTVATIEETPYTFTLSDFNYSDPDTDTFTKLRIGTPPSAGALELLGVPVVLNQEIDTADIGAGNLKFVPAVDGNGTGYASFSFQVHDGIGYSVASYAMTIDVTAVNDAASGADNTVAALEDTPYVFVAADFGFSDVLDGDALLGVKITTLPGAGTLSNNAVAVNAGDTISAVDIAAGRLVFTPASDGNGIGYTSFTFQVQDDGGTANGGVDIDATPNTLSIDVTAVNDAPAGADNTVSTLEDTPYTFTTADFGFSDALDGDALLGVRITTLPTLGTLSNNATAVSAGDTIAAADIALGRLVFTPASDGNGIGYTSFTFQVQDAGGSTNGGVDIDAIPNTLSIDVTAVNDAPAGADNTVSTLEDTPYTFTAADFGFSDAVEGDTLLGVRITTLPGVGTLTNNASAVGASDTISAVDIAAGRLIFTPAADANGVGYTSFTFQVQDAGGNANGGVDIDATPNTLTIDVTPVNDAPAGADTTVSALEDTPYIFVAADFGFSDVADGDALLGVKISTLPVVGTLTNNAVAVSAGATISIADITAGRLQFTPGLNQTGLGYASFDFQAQDDGGTANAGMDIDATPNTLSIDVFQVNSAPSGTDNTVSALEDTPYVFLSFDFGFADLGNSPANTLLGVKITTLPAAGTLTNNAIAVSAGDTIGAADIAAGLLVFTPAANANGVGYASFTFQVQDDGGTVNGGVDLDPTPNSLTIDVTPVNDAPAGADNIVVTLEDAPYTFLAVDFGFSDTVEGDALLGVKISTLPLAGTLTNNAVAVSAGDAISAADIAAGRLVFTPAVDANGVGYASISFQVQDDGGTANGGVNIDASPNTLTINVTPVNDAPAGADNTVSTLENNPYTFVTADFGFSDTIDGHTLLGVKITTLPVAGMLTNNAVAVSVGDTISAADIAAGRLQFTPGLNDTGLAYASFSFQVQDSGGTANSGVDLDTMARTMRIDVFEVNSAPTGADKTVTTLEDMPYIFVAADFGFSDASNSPANALLAVKITTLPGAGTLSNNTVALSAGDSVSAVDIAAGRLVFIPAANASGAAYASFTFQVQDDGGTASGGVDIDPIPNTLTIDVTAVNDAPIGSNNTVTTLEDNPYTFATADFAFSDPVEGDALLAVKVTTLPSAGTLSNNGAGVSAGDTISATDIAAGKLVFTPSANASGAAYASFTFQVQDDGGTANTGIDLDASANVLTIDVTGVNDAPAGSNNTVTTLEDTPYTFAAGDFGYFDPLEGDALLGVKITTLPGAGTLSNNGVAVNVGDIIGIGDISAGRLQFIPGSGEIGAGYANLSFQVLDDGGTLNGGADTDPTPNTVTIDVSANVAPTIEPIPTPLPIVTVPPITPIDLGLPDPVAETDNSILAVLVPPASGVFSLNGTPVAVGQLLGLDSIRGGALSFTPPAGADGIGQTAFAFAVLESNDADTGAVSERERRRVAPRSFAQQIGHALEKALGEAARDALDALAAQLGLDDNAGLDPNDATNQDAFRRALDRLNSGIADQSWLDSTVLGSTLTVSAGLSIGYVAWLARGGVLVASLISSAPVWRALDPIPVLAHARREDDDEPDEDESLASLVSERTKPRAAAGDDVNTTHLTGDPE